MALVVIFQEDEDVPRLYRNLNLKIFYETAPSSPTGPILTFNNQVHIVIAKTKMEWLLFYI